MYKFASITRKAAVHKTVIRLCSEAPKKAFLPRTGPISYMSLGLAAFVGIGIVAFYNSEKERLQKEMLSKVKVTGKAALGGTWSLVDQDGVPRTSASYNGQYQLLYFGFTHCPDICPNELVKVGKVLDELEKKGIKSVKPIFISVDPSRDTVGQLKHFSQDFHRDMVYLTGTTEQVAKITRAYRVYFSKVDEQENDDEEYLVDHSIVLYFLAPDGEFLEFFTQRALVGDIVDKIAGIVKSKK